MDLVKVYMIQSITAASNNLRLNAQQIEVVGLLRETIMKSPDLGEDLTKMKKTTALSKLAIRLNEIYIYLTAGKVDFLKISEQFREHSRYLIRDLNQFLENVSPQLYNESIGRMNTDLAEAITKQENEIDVDLAKRELHTEDLLINENTVLKEELILDDDKINHNRFRDFEDQILKPIKAIDDLLKKMLYEKVEYDELDRYTEILDYNGEESNQRGFTIISDMHKVLSVSFKRFKSGNLVVNKYVIDSLRACLIVIAAVVRGKEVDITEYLNRAEEFGKKILENNKQVQNK